jgi:hypothetical protein
MSCRIGFGDATDPATELSREDLWRVLPAAEKQCGRQPREGPPAAQMKKLD